LKAQNVKTDRNEARREAHYGERRTEIEKEMINEVKIIATCRHP